MDIEPWSGRRASASLSLTVDPDPSPRRPVPPRLVQRWEAQAHAHPDHEAVRADGHASLSYADASATAHRWAEVWRQHGVRPGDRVLLRCTAGPSWVVAVWAAWLAGLVWTPCPPDVAPEHADTILHDLDPRLVVRAPGLLDQPEFEYRAVSRIPTTPGVAYIVYAASTTGTPRGVVVLHDGLVAMVDDLARACAVDHDTVALWMRAPASDASIADVGTVLAGAGTLVIEPRQAWRHYDAWARLIGRHGITLVDLPASCLIAWAHRAPPVGLQTVIARAGTAPAMMVRQWSGRVRWINVHARIETTVCSGLDRRRPEDGASTTHERPIQGLVYRVLPEGSLSADVEPVSEGELWVGGPGVAQGYWRQPGLSDQRFWTDPGGTRWFRTGETIRRSGATWSRLGRLPRQVQRFGHALDLDEVEAVLTSLPGVHHAIVWAEPAEPNGVPGTGERLIAAVHGDDPDHLAAWKMQAAERLPDWGVPQQWWWSDQWPTVSTGALDRQAVRNAWARGQALLPGPHADRSTWSRAP